MLTALFGVLIFTCSNTTEWNGRIEIKDGVVYIYHTKQGLLNNSKAMKWEKILTIGEDDSKADYVFARTSDIDVDEKGNIYVCDFLDNCIKVFDENGFHLNTIGRHGQGPGELYGPSKLEYANGKIFVYDAGNRRLSIYADDGNFLNSFIPQFPTVKQADPVGDTALITPSVFDMQVDTNSNIIFSMNFYAGNEDIISLKPIYHLDEKGNFINSYGEMITIGQTNLGHQTTPMMIALTKESKLYSAYLHTYEIRVLDREGNLEKVIKKESELLNKRQLLTLNDFQMLMTRGRISCPVVFPDCKFIVIVSDQGENFGEDFKKQFLSSQQGKNYEYNVNRYYDLFDHEGRFLQRFAANPEYGFIRFVDDKGFVYTTNSSNEIPAVHKYKLTFVGE